jgi:hypothetical protein
MVGLKPINIRRSAGSPWKSPKFSASVVNDNELDRLRRLVTTEDESEDDRLEIETRMSEDERVAGDAIPSNCVQIEVHVAELKQLFNAMDPSPFRERDLDPKAEEFIVGWAREAPRDARLALLVRLNRGAGPAEEPAALREAIEDFFTERAVVTRRRLRDLFRRGRISLLIGLAALSILTVLGNFVVKAMPGHVADLLRESLSIGGWVAMWRPIEVFLYDWWPIRAEARLYDRLGVMPVRIAYTDPTKPDAWRTDWPTVSPSDKTPDQRSR